MTIRLYLDEDAMDQEGARMEKRYGAGHCEKDEEP
jgi:hypothetical protein